MTAVLFTPSFVLIVTFTRRLVEIVYTRRSVARLCLTPCDPVDYSSPGYSVHGILQERTLE